jgi:DNA-binding MarR family transcriptional regulator
MLGMPDRRTLAETEKAMTDHVGRLTVDFPAANAVSSLYRAANTVRNHLTNTVLRRRDLTWTGFVVLWVVWIWDGMETRHAAESAAISKATLTGVVKTLESRGWMVREADTADRRLVHLRLTAEGVALMESLYPEFNAAESEVISALSTRSVADMTRSLRRIVSSLEESTGEGAAAGVVASA